MNIPTCRKSHLTGFVVTRLEAKVLCGQGKHSAGAILILKGRPVMALRLTGLSVIKTLHRGIVMLKNLPVSAATKMALILCLMENFYQPGTLPVLKLILRKRLQKTLKTGM